MKMRFNAVRARIASSIAEQAIAPANLNKDYRKASDWYGRAAVLSPRRIDQRRHAKSALDAAFRASRLAA